MPELDPLTMVANGRVSGSLLIAQPASPADRIAHNNAKRSGWGYRGGKAQPGGQPADRRSRP